MTLRSVVPDMAETITFRTARLETGQLIIDIPYDQRGTAMAWLKSKKDTDYDLTIKEHREKRSLDANAYAWVLIGKLAAAMHIKPVEVYRQQIMGLAITSHPCVSGKRMWHVLSPAGSGTVWDGSLRIWGRHRLQDAGIWQHTTVPVPTIHGRCPD